MEISTAAALVKERVGIRTSNARDKYIEAIINGIIDELKNEQGIDLDLNKPRHLMFLVDYATWRHDNRESRDGLPRHLQFRLHNMLIHDKAVKS